VQVHELLWLAIKQMPSSFGKQDKLVVDIALREHLQASSGNSIANRLGQGLLEDQQDDNNDNNDNNNNNNNSNNNNNNAFQLMMS